MPLGSPGPGQVDFLTKSIVFKAYLPNKQESRQVIL